MPTPSTPELMTFRCTFFMNTIFDSSIVKKIFSVITDGIAPTSVTEQGPMVAAHGQMDPDSTVLICQGFPGKLDFIWNSTKSVLLPTLAVYSAENVLAYISLIKNSIFTALPSVSRLAVGGDVIFKVPDVASGYSVMSSMLTNINSLSYPQQSDFFYRINIPTSMMMNGSKTLVNRICQWAVAEAYTTIGATVMHVPQSSYVGVNFDINTGQESILDITGERALTEIKKLIPYIDDIVKNGDKLIC